MKTTLSAIALTTLLGSTAANATDYQGWWWSAATDGMGLNVAQQVDTLAVAWYHFDGNRSPSYVLLAGKLINGVLSGELQTASGPPPGSDYNPANVVRHTIGTATLTFRPSAPGSDQTTATFEYTLNGRNGSFELTRFNMPESLPDNTYDPEQFYTWRYASNYSGNCGESTSTGIATLTAFPSSNPDYPGFYTVETQAINADERCSYTMYHKDLTQSATGLSGSGRFYCKRINNNDTPGANPNARSGTITVRRLHMENAALVFDHSRQHTEGPRQGCGETATFTTTPFFRSDTYTSDWWWDPSQDGMGVNIEQRGDTLALAWYHFDEDRSPTYILFTGKRLHGFLIGQLQKASGPPPGPEYDPAGVAREIAGTGILRFGSNNVADFTYTLQNGRSGTLNLTRFSMQEIPLAGTWKYLVNRIRTDRMYPNPTSQSDSTGIATMEKIGDNHYRLTTHEDSDVEFRVDKIDSCVYDLMLTQSGSIFTGDGQVSCTDNKGKFISNGTVTVERLHAEKERFVFSYRSFAPIAEFKRNGEFDYSYSDENGILGGTRLDTIPWKTFPADHIIRRF